MPTTTPLNALRAALADADAATDACLTVAQVDAYEAAHRRADALLEAILAAGGAKGLDAVVIDAASRAGERLSAAYVSAASDQVATVAEDAHRRALARERAVNLALLAWLKRKAAA